MKAITALILLAITALADSALAATQAVVLVAHNQRSSSGTRHTLVWKECTPSTNLPPCLYSPPSSWQVTNGVVGSDATWTWDGETGVLTGSGLYWATSYINSSPVGTSVISDKVSDLVIDTQNDTTNASSYQCIEGTFLAGVNAAGCMSINLGYNSINDSLANWNVGGNSKCVMLNIGGDDYSLLDGHNATISLPAPLVPGAPNPRGLTVETAGQAGAGCNRTTGAFDLWTVVQDNLSSGGTLILSNGIDINTCTLPVDINCQGANWMTFSAATPVPAPAVGWLLVPVFAGWFRRGNRTS